MDRTNRLYQAYVQILKEELIPAMGCTEPIAIAYAAAKAREVLGRLPEAVSIGVSNNIIKNVKSVIVPNTDGMKGIEAAAAAGIVGGRADKALEVIAEVTAEQKAEMRRFLETVPTRVEAVDNGLIFDIIIRLEAGQESAVVRIAQYHTNIVYIEKNGQVLLDQAPDQNQAACGHEGPAEDGLTDHGLLTIADILDFADTCDLADIRPVLDTQIQYNTQISEEGLLGDYGANIGSTMLKFYGDDVRNRAIAKAAAGSDARMSGCELPVVINSGSGNQGITVSVPVMSSTRAAATRASRCRSPSSSTPRPWPPRRSGSTARWRSPTSSPSTKRAASAGCRPTAARSAPGAPPAAASPICRGPTTRPSPTPWSTAWPSSRGSSATGPSPAARPRSPPASKPASWATICT